MEAKTKVDFEHWEQKWFQQMPKVVDVIIGMNEVTVKDLNLAYYVFIRYNLSFWREEEADNHIWDFLLSTKLSHLIFSTFN